MNQKLSLASNDFSGNARRAYLRSRNRAEAAHHYQFRKAGVLDIPYIFTLLQEGSFIGSFSNFLMTSKGYFLVLKMLFSEMLPLRLFKSKQEEGQFYIFSLDRQDIGFIKIKTLLFAGGLQVIDLCAIDPALRNQKHGSQMIRMYLESLPAGTDVIAYCTKYSRAMQHILARQKFRRDKRSFRLECYHFKKSADIAQAIPSANVTPEKKNSSLHSELLSPTH